MKAMGQTSWKQGAPLELIDLPTPEPKPNELRVSVQVIGVNPVDWKMRASGPLRFMARLLGPPPPVVVGVDFAGIVDAIGAKISHVKVGDRVVGGTNFSRGQRGSYADTVIVREDQVAVLPDGFDLELAGALPVTGVTAWMSIVDIGGIGKQGVATSFDPTTAPKALVLGAAGGVGQLAVQVARSQGAYVVGVCSTRNVELVRSLGAHEVIDYTQGDALAAAAALGRYQVISDSVGSYSGKKCRKLLASGGRHAMVAGDSPGAMLSVLIPPWTSRPVLGKPTRARLEPLVAMIAAGKLKITITERLALADAERAHQLSKSARMTGKIVLRP